MPTTGIDKLPYPNSGDIPDGPAAFQLLDQRLSLMKGAGIGYAADSTALAALISNGDAFTGFFAYYAAADALVRYNGTAFKLWGVKRFADVTAQGTWTTSYSGLLEVGSASLVAATMGEFRYSGSAWALANFDVDSGWITPSLINSWANFSGSYSLTKYRKLNGVLYIKGFVRSGTGTVFQLPVGMRPLETQVIVVASALSTGLLNIDNSGNVMVNSYGTGGSNANVQLNCSFVPEQ